MTDTDADTGTWKHAFNIPLYRAQRCLSTQLGKEMACIVHISYTSVHYRMSTGRGRGDGIIPSTEI